MKGVFNTIAGCSLFVGTALAQNYAAEYNRICSSPPQGEVEIENGVYATIRCGQMPYGTFYKHYLPANTPESCVKACAALPGCQSVSWGTVGGAAGCHAFDASKAFNVSGNAYITYRQDCQKQTQPTIDRLNKDLQHHQALLGQCVKDKATADSELAACVQAKNTAVSNLATCQGDLKKCKQDLDGSDGDTNSGTNVIPSSCNQLKEGDILNVGHAKFKVRKDTAKKVLFFRPGPFMTPPGTKGPTLGHCLQQCAADPKCARLDYHPSRIQCDPYPPFNPDNIHDRLVPNPGWCHYEKL